MSANSLISRDQFQLHLQNDAAFRIGWVEFSGKMALFNNARMTQLENIRQQWMAKKGKSYSYMNLLRNLGQEAARLALYANVSGSSDAAAKARVLLECLLEEEAWIAHAPKNGWHSDLWTADMAAAAGLSLEFAGDFWPADFCLALKKAVLERGVGPVFQEWVEPESRIHALDSMGHNWWSVCVCGALIGLFACAGEDRDAQKKFALAAGAILEFFEYPGNVLQNKKRTFGKDGDFIESVGYLDYTLQHLVVVLDLYRQRLGRDLAGEIPVLQAIPDYYLALAQPLLKGMQRLNFGDMGAGADTVGSYQHHPAAVWLWLARRYDRKDLLWLVKKAHPVPNDIFPFLYWHAGEGLLPSLGDRVFDNIGVGVLRDGFGDEATVFAIKTGETWNHNQSDAGSFILSAGGVEFFTDPGTTEYSSPLHASYFKRGFSHNIVLRDGRDQDVHLDAFGTKFSGTIASSLLTPEYKYLLADATGPWEGVYRRSYRHVIWSGRWMVLVDELMAWAPGSCTSLYHYAGTCEPMGTREFHIHNEGKTLRAHLLRPEPSALRFADGHWSRKVPSDLKFEYETGTAAYLCVDYPGDSGRQILVTALELPGPSNTDVESVCEESRTTLRLRSANRLLEVFVNHRADGSVMHLNSDQQFGDLVTDAFLVTREFSQDREMERLTMHNGSRMHVDGRFLMGSLLKGEFCWQRNAEGSVLNTNLTSRALVSLGSPLCGDASDGQQRMDLQVPAGPFVHKLKHSHPSQ
jgi:oligo-alginate lyase